MLPLNRRAALLLTRQLLQRAGSTVYQRPNPPPDPHAAQEPLTGSAKLFADAAEEEAAQGRNTSRDHLVDQQGPVWTGDESVQDTVLRMLIDSKYKPLRTGEGVKPDAADKKIHQWMANFDQSSPLDSPALPIRPPESQPEVVNKHRTTIPPHLHRPWHSTYTGDLTAADFEMSPKIKYGKVDKRKYDDFDNILELRLPPGADGKTRSSVRDARRSHKLRGRLTGARESAIDYRLGVKDGDITDVGVEAEEDDVFQGNRQLRGTSVLGAQKGGASGMKAWAGLVEDRIQTAQKSGYFRNVSGKGAPLEKDVHAGVVGLELGEVFMNRIIQRQGALPPWIELQRDVDASIDTFRSVLLEDYTRAVARKVLASHELKPLPPMRIIPEQDEQYESRERKFHEASVQDINNRIRKMNAQAPQPARRGLVTLERELANVRGDTLRESVMKHLIKRIEYEEELSRMGAPGQRRFLSQTGNGSNPASGSGIGGAMARLFDGGSTRSGEQPKAGGGMGLIIATGVGVAALVYYKRPLQTESAIPEVKPDLIPVHEDHFVARSPREERKSFSDWIRQYILEPILTVARFLHLAFLFLPVIVTSPMLFVGSRSHHTPGDPIAESGDNWGAVWWYGFLVKQMERAGPSFIKLGQWAASRADLFPDILCQKMSKLHSSNNPHPFRHTKWVIEKAFCMKFEDIFEEFCEEPIGCGAIAQVYKARLRPEILVGSKEALEEFERELVTLGNRAQADDRRVVTDVAVKILHPRVRPLVRRDIAIMSVFANIINAFPGMVWISLPEEVQVFGEMMNQQLDLRVEASNLDRFITNFADRPPSVTFPRPIQANNENGDSKYKRDVLIEQFENAVPLKYFLANGGGPYDESIASTGLDSFLEMLLLDNWTHGDLHPGNIMVRFVKPEWPFKPLWHIFQKKSEHSDMQLPPTESTAEAKIVKDLMAISHDKEAWLNAMDDLESQGYAPQLVFLDAGLVTSLNGENRRNFLDLFQAIAEFDGYRAGKLMVERCRHPDLAIDEEVFALKIQHLVLNVKSKTFSLAKIKISDILSSVLMAVRQHHVKLEGDFVNTVISVLLLEGIGRQLDPNMDLFKSALPIMRQVGRQMSTREAMSQVPAGNIWAMIKVWVWAEAREVVGEGQKIDQWIKYDLLTPNI